MRTFYTRFEDGAPVAAEGRYELDNLDSSLERRSPFARGEGWVEAKAEVARNGEVVERDLVMRRGAPTFAEGAFWGRNAPLAGARAPFTHLAACDLGVSIRGYFGDGIWSGQASLTTRAGTSTEVRDMATRTPVQKRRPKARRSR